MPRVPHTRAQRVGFTLVELLVVVGILALLMAILLPSLSSARQSAQRTACLANVRSLAVAQALYATSQKDLLVVAGQGSYDVQGSWIGLLEKYAGHALVRRCPSDQSPHFDSPYLDPSLSTPAYRLTSFAINNYVSPTHSPAPLSGEESIRRISQIKRPAGVIQFVEVAETGADSVSDHVHAQDFYKALTPQLTPARVSVQMPVGRHGGRFKDWSGVLNYSFLDGHAERLALQKAYVDPKRNHFNPAVAP